MNLPKLKTKSQSLISDIFSCEVDCYQFCRIVRDQMFSRHFESTLEYTIKYHKQITGYRNITIEQG